ncbi:hypothetical protein D3C81_2233860 [compost metagenome]
MKKGQADRMKSNSVCLAFDVLYRLNRFLVLLVLDQGFVFASESEKLTDTLLKTASPVATGP